MQVCELIQQERGISITPIELRTIQQETTIAAARRQVTELAAGVYRDDVRADLGKTLGFVFGAVLGAFLLPGLGLGLGLLSGALLGGSIGYQLVKLFDGSRREGPTKTTTDPLFKFSGTGSLAVLGSPIPLIYGNRDRNPFGGAMRRDPPVIWSKVRAVQTSQRLERVSLLSTGKLGRVNKAGLQLDDKPLTDFGVGDAKIEISTGLPNQQPLAGVTGYSQAVSITANGFVGRKPGVVAPNQRPPDSVYLLTAGPQSYTGGGGGNTEIGSYDTIAASNWASGGWCTAWHNLSDTRYGAYVGVRSRGETTQFGSVGGVGLDWGLGYSSTGTDPRRSALDICGTCSSTGVWQVLAFGAVIASGTGVPIGNLQEAEFRIYRSYPEKFAQFIIAGREVWRGQVAIADSVRPALLMGRANQILKSAYGSPSAGLRFTPGEISPGIGFRFTVNADGLDKLKSAQSYTTTNPDGHPTLIAISPADNWVEFGSSLWISDWDTHVAGLADYVLVGGRLDATYRSAITTSKSVTSIEFTIQAKLWARNGSNALVDHGQGIRIKIAPALGEILGQQPIEYDLGTFLLVGSTEKTIQHSVLISGLPKGAYKISIDGANTFSAPVRKLDGSATATSIATGVVIGGQPVMLATEIATGLVSATEANALCAYGTSKPQTSGDGGPSIQISHINEIVDTPIPPKYIGYTVAKTALISSDRITSAPAETWDVEQGLICRNYLHSTEVATFARTEDVSLGDIVEFGLMQPLPPEIKVGDIVQVLRKDQHLVITAISAAPTYTVTCDSIIRFCDTVAGSAEITVPADVYAFVYIYMTVGGGSYAAPGVVLDKLPNNKLVIGTRWGAPLYPSRTEAVTLEFNGADNQLMRPEVGDELVVYSMGSSNYFPDVYVDRLINPVTGQGNFINEDHFIDYESICYARRFCVKHKYFYDAVVVDGAFEEWAIATAPSSLLYPTEINGRYALVCVEDEPPDYLFTSSNTSAYNETGTPWQQSATTAMLVKYQNNLGREQQVKILTAKALAKQEPEITRTVSCQGVTDVAQAVAVGKTALQGLRRQLKVFELETDIANGFYTRQGKIIRTLHKSIQYCIDEEGWVTAVEPPSVGYLRTVGTVQVELIQGGWVTFAGNHNLVLAPDTLDKTSDALTIVGSNSSADGPIAANRITIVTSSKIYVSGILADAFAVRGAANINRLNYNQVVKLSEELDLTERVSTSVATFVHLDSMDYEEDRPIADLGAGRYQLTQLEAPLAVGDPFTCGSEHESLRTWRITSVQPDVEKNTVKLTGIQWSKDALNFDDLVAIGNDRDAVAQPVSIGEPLWSGQNINIITGTWAIRLGEVGRSPSALAVNCYREGATATPIAPAQSITTGLFPGANVLVTFANLTWTAGTKFVISVEAIN